MEFYHDGMRALQREMDSERLANRLRELTVHDTLTESDRDFITGSSMVFVATADAQGQPDCSYKGGQPGFIRVVDDSTLMIPFYDGNGQYRTLGNVHVNPAVGLLFIDFDKPSRLRLNGHAEVLMVANEPETVRGFHEAEAVLRVTIGVAFPNCPRYVHNVKQGTVSEFAPLEGRDTPQPEWKSRASFQPYLPKYREPNADTR